MTKAEFSVRASFALVADSSSYHRDQCFASALFCCGHHTRVPGVKMASDSSSSL